GRSRVAVCCAPAVSLWWRVGWTSRHSLLGLPSGKTGSMSCQQVPTAPALKPYPRSVQVGEFEVAISGGVWVAIREVDAIFVKGAEGILIANLIGAQVVVQTGQHPDPIIRVNNGCPRPLTVDDALVQERPDLVTKLVSL